MATIYAFIWAASGAPCNAANAVYQSFMHIFSRSCSYIRHGLVARFSRTARCALFVVAGPRRTVSLTYRVPQRSSST